MSAITIVDSIRMLSSQDTGEHLFGRHEDNRAFECSQDPVEQGVLAQGEVNLCQQ